MNRYFVLTMCTLFLVVIAGGCIDELVPVNKEDPTQDPSAYEFEVFLNNSYDAEGQFIPTHTFYLSKEVSAKVVSIVENESVIDIMPLEDLRTSRDGVVSNIVVLGDLSERTKATSGSLSAFSMKEEPYDINYTITEEVIRGQKHVFITFERPITGFVAYTVSKPLGHDFMYVTTPPSIVRFVLPPGYTTGNPLIGKVKPSPYMVFYDSSARENLVWKNELESTSLLNILGRNSLDGEKEPIPKLISVKFYTLNAPRDLGIAVFILGSFAFLVFSRYRAERKRLEQLRRNIEDNFILPKKKGKD
ncbi:MAG: hypothetical protein QCH31_01640 [Methanolobus sp.]|nr:hypothetical protein [Methanolobus sp.]